MTNSGVIVRQAKSTDVPGLVSLEKRVWTPFKTEVFTAAHFQAWLKVHPAGFLIAEAETGLVGYIYYQLVRFDLIGFLNSDYNLTTDNGYTIKTNDPDGDCFYVVSACSTNLGAGFLLVSTGQKMTITQKLKCAVAFCRISGFADYFEAVKSLNKLGEIHPSVENDIVLWYAIENARSVNGRVDGLIPPDIQLELPSLGKVDPVLGKVLRYPGVSLAGISSGYIIDPLSRDFGAFVIFNQRELST